MRVSVARFGDGVKVALVIVAALAFTPALNSQEPAAPPELAGVAHVAIRTANLAEARAFFEKLGFVQAFELMKNGVPTEDFIKISDRQFLELYPAQGELPTGFMHICYDVEQLQALNDAYVTRGLEPTPAKKAGAGNLLFVLHGPEQQVIEFTEYMPGSMHSEDRGKHLGESRIAARLAGVALSLKDPGAAESYYVQRLGFKDLGMRDGARVIGLPGPSGQDIGLLPTGSKPVFALIFSVEDLRSTEQKLRTAGLAPTLHKSLVMIDGPENSLIVFTSKSTS